MTRRDFVDIACRSSAVGMFGWLVGGLPRVAYGQTTSTIGTTGRTYSTMASWESTVTGANEIGECYDDTAFNEQLALNNPNCTTQMRLTAEANERHDGTAGSGVRIDRDVGQFNNVTTVINTVGPEIEWIEWDGNDNDSTFGGVGIGPGQLSHVHHCLVHDMTMSGGLCKGINVGVSTNAPQVYRNFVWDIKSTDTGSNVCAGVGHSGSSDIGDFSNNTVFFVDNDNGTGACYCYGLTNDLSGNNFDNCLGFDAQGSSSGTIQDWQDTNIVTGTARTNGSSDTTASGTSPLTSLTTTNELVSTTGGMEDLHLDNTTSTVLTDGTDLGTSPSDNGDDIGVDIDGFDVDTDGSSWEPGADQYSTSVSTGRTGNILLGFTGR